MQYLTKDLRTRGLHETELPIPYDAAAHPGARALGTDGMEYVSVRWPTPNDPYTWVTAAERVVDELINLTVHHTNPAADYASLSDALSFLAPRMPSTRLPPLPFTITFLSGHIESEQIIDRNNSFNHVRIVAEDAEVIVDEMGITEPSTSGGLWPLYEFHVQPPVFSCVMRSNQARTAEDNGDKITGLLARNGFYSNGLGSDDNGNLTPPAAGFTHFAINVSVRFSAGARTFPWSVHTYARRINLEAMSGGITSLQGDYTRSQHRGIVADHTANVWIGALTDARCTPGVDSADDIVARNNSTIRINSSVMGGTSIRPWTMTKDGFIADFRAEDQPHIFAGILAPESYATQNDLPAAAEFDGGIARADDDGLPYISDGERWRPLLTNEFGDLVTALLGGLHSNAGQISKLAVEANEFSASGSPRILSAIADLYMTQSQVARDQSKIKASVQSESAVREALSIIGQISKRLEGGRITLNTGSATEPSITIGDIGIYASANDALSVAISGTEMARLTSDGLTIYGTITEAP